MQITTEQIQANIPVTILRLSGDLDGSNYRDVIAKAQELHRSGARHLIIDLTNVPFMSSAGIVALHNAALLFGGKEAPDVENGWRALKAVSSAEEAGMQAQVNLTRSHALLKRSTRRVCSRSSRCSKMRRLPSVLSK
jgi:hypothetical protein